MKYEDYDPLSKNITVTMSEKDLAVLYSAVVDAFAKTMNEKSVFWNETDKILNELSAITTKFTEEQKQYDEYAKANR